MNKMNKGILFILLGLLCASNGFAQDKEPTRWTFEARKKNDNNYELIAHCLIAKGWHIFAMRPGGDGSLIPTSIVFNKNINANYLGIPKENGKLLSQTMEGIKGKVNMYENRVDIVQQATMNGKGKIFATLTYQTCNDKMCLPPKTKEVVFDVN